MVPEKMLSDEVLQQAAKKSAEAIITSLPAPEECNHKFSKRFEEKFRHYSHQSLSISLVQSMYLDSKNSGDSGIIAVLLFRYWLNIG